MIRPWHFKNHAGHYNNAPSKTSELLDVERCHERLSPASPATTFHFLERTLHNIGLLLPA
jgi:hypothetical protein